MFHSPVTRESFKKKKRRKLPAIIFIVVLSLLAVVGTWVTFNYDTILFKFKTDKYKFLLEDFTFLNSLYVSEDNVSVEADTLNEAEKLIDSMLDDHNDDPFLYYLQGQISWVKLRNAIDMKAIAIQDIFIYDYLEKHYVPKSFPKKSWQKSVTSTRKALAIGLPDKYTKSANYRLSWLYFLSGHDNWNSLKDIKLLNDENDITLKNIYYIIFHSKTPDWDVINNFFGNETGEIWKAIYSLKSGNVPKGYSILKKLSISESVNLRNNANYILGHLMMKQKKTKLQLYYHQKIEMAEFLQRNPWFLEEHMYTLRFLGKNSEAKQFLAAHEAMLLQQKKQSSQDN